MGFIKEFKEFAIKGNVVDLAVAVIFGDVTRLNILEAAGASNIAELAWGSVKYGNFLSAVINFFFIALVLFIMIKGINRLRKEEVKDETPATPTQEELLSEIRDLLKNK